MVMAVSLCDDFSMALTVLIVDDHRAFRASARTLLELEGFNVIGEAENGTNGVDLARRLSPDVVLLDIALPDMSGFDVAKRLPPKTKVILTSSRQSSDFGKRVHQSGALGFIPKDHLSGDSMRRLLEAA
jgi:DNA-binding NarL/FixJ family response regulator